MIEGPGFCLRGDYRQSGFPQPAGRLSRIIDCLAPPNERCRVPPLAFVPAARARPGHQNARQHFPHARKPRPARPHEGELQPMYEEPGVHRRLLG